MILTLRYEAGVTTRSGRSGQIVLHRDIISIAAIAVEHGPDFHWLYREGEWVPPKYKMKFQSATVTKLNDDGTPASPPKKYAIP